MSAPARPQRLKCLRAPAPPAPPVGADQRGGGAAEGLAAAGGGGAEPSGERGQRRMEPLMRVQSTNSLDDSDDELSSRLPPAPAGH